MQVSLRHQRLDFLDRLNRAASPGSSAVESGRGGGKLELALQRPVTKQAVDESGMKYVAGARCIGDVYPVRRRVVEFAAIPGKYAIAAESGSSQTAFQPS